MLSLCLDRIVRRYALVSAFAILGVLAVSAPTNADPAQYESILVNEVFTNADGTLQFVELIAIAAGQTDLPPTHVESLNHNATDTNMVFDFTATMPQLGNGETVLLATSGVATALGFQPDKIIPNGSIFFTGGRVIFDRDVGLPIDAVAYGNYTGDNTGYGTPAGALPTDGNQSLTRIHWSTSGKNNSADFVYAVNTPTRNDGRTGTLQGVPLAPVLDPIGSKQVNEGQVLNFEVTASDGNGTIPTFSLVNVPPGSSFIDHLDGSATFNWATTYLQSNVYNNVLFIASDGALADSESITITVIEVTNPPQARDTATSGTEDISLPTRFQAYDPDANPLKYEILVNPTIGQATVFDSTTGTFTYVPNPNANGNDSISFRVHDQWTYSNTAKWRVVVDPVNDLPIASDVNANTIKNTSIDIGSMPVTDVDNATWTISHVSGPWNGVVDFFMPNTGNFQYTPVFDYFGPDSISYVAFDGFGNSNTAKIRIQVYEACACPCPADPECDGIRSDVLDVISTINVAFRGSASTTDPGCARQRTDVDCSGASDVLDVVLVIGVAFRGQSAATSYCNPCAP